MPQARQISPDRLAAIEAKRSGNLRQLLLKASRIVNRHVVEELHARGYSRLRSTHTTLLSNIDLAGSSVTAAAERAGITKQAMGRLATELETAGYLRVDGDPKDARVKLLRLTNEGCQLMMDSFEVMNELESRYAGVMSKARLAALQRGLLAFIKELHGD
jgi:DNA-binding MarR family transcriptional regulator